MYSLVIRKALHLVYARGKILNGKANPFGKWEGGKGKGKEGSDCTAFSTTLFNRASAKHQHTSHSVIILNNCC